MQSEKSGLTRHPINIERILCRTAAENYFSCFNAELAVANRLSKNNNIRKQDRRDGRSVRIRNRDRRKLKKAAAEKSKPKNKNGCCDPQNQKQITQGKCKH